MRISLCPDKATCRDGLAQGGFTLIEILIVMSLLAIVYALALPALGSLTAEGRLDRAANALHGELRAARAQALLEGQSVALDVVASVADPDIGVTLKNTAAGETVAERKIAQDRRVRFFPDGSATGRHIVLSLDGSQRAVDLDWLTGNISLAAQ